MHPRPILAAIALLLATVGCRDLSESPTDPSPTASRDVRAEATTLVFWQLSGGASHTCAVTTTHQAYC
jgi:hypothetical protein